VLVLGGGAAALALFLLVGYLLPSNWHAEASAHLPLAPDALFPLIDSPEGWRRWTPWPESGVERSGPARGAGASLAWDDAELGAGSFTILQAAEPSRVDYSVLVEGGSMTTAGTLTVAPEQGGARVTWREEGDLGWNPLMGYWALSMNRAQSQELAKGLDRLRSVALDAATAAPLGAAATPD
jgi:hypothetical protein